VDERSQNQIAVDLARQLLDKGGELPITVDSISMSPCAQKGDKYLFTAADGDIKVGDIVLVEGAKRAVTHRVIWISGDRLLLKGDIRPDYDGFLTRDEAVAVCKTIACGDETRLLREGREKRLGRVTAFLSRWHGRLFRLTGSSRNVLSRIAFVPFHYWHWLLLNLIYRRRSV